MTLLNYPKLMRPWEVVAAMQPLNQTPAVQPAQPRGILAVTPDELRSWLGKRGEPMLRAEQIRRWIVQRGAEQFEQMSDLPKKLREELATAFVPLASRIDQHLEAADGT